MGDVGAEVVAAGAAEPQGAGFPAGLDVGWFAARAERDSNLADRVPGVLGVQQHRSIPPDPVAVPVELHRGDLVDRLAAAALANPVVAFGDVEGGVIHQFAEHIDGDPGVGVTRVCR